MLLLSYCSCIIPVETFTQFSLLFSWFFFQFVSLIHLLLRIFLRMYFLYVVLFSFFYVVPLNLQVTRETLRSINDT